MTLGAIPESRSPRVGELEREEKFASGRVVLVAVDHGPNSSTAFSWALDEFLTPADTVNLLHVLPKAKSAAMGDSSPLYNAAQLLFDKLVKQAFEANVKAIPTLRSGDAGKEICAEAERSMPCAIVMGSRGLGPVKSLLVGSATEYCVRHSPVPLLIVPHKYHPSCDSAQQSVEDIDDK